MPTKGLCHNEDEGNACQKNPPEEIQPHNGEVATEVDAQETQEGSADLQGTASQEEAA